MRPTLRAILIVISAALTAADAYAGTPRDSILDGITGCPEAKAVVMLDARGDGVKDCLPAFNKAVKKAEGLISRHGSARIVVPPGQYLLNGPIHFISGLTLEISEGATLLFSSNPDHYLPVVETSWEGTYCSNYSPFIYGKDLHDVAITGGGTIDGNGECTFRDWRGMQDAGRQRSRDYNHDEAPAESRVMGDGHYLRPHLIQFYGCSNVTIEGVKIVESPFWCVHLLQCDNVICRGLRFDARLANNDGIDPESSRNILIEDIDFNNGDDNIAIKSGRDNDGRLLGLPSENIIIRGCSFKGLHAVVIGSEMSGGIRNVWIDDCTFGGYCKRGLYIKTNPDRGAYIHDVYMRNCHFGEVENLVYVTSRYAGEGLDNTHYTDIRDIHVSDVSCRRANGTAIVLQGTEQRPLQQITFDNVDLGYARTGIDMTNVSTVELHNCHLGDSSDEVPSQFSAEDRIFRQ